MKIEAQMRKGEDLNFVEFFCMRNETLFPILHSSDAKIAERNESIATRLPPRPASVEKWQAKLLLWGHPFIRASEANAGITTDVEPEFSRETRGRVLQDFGNDDYLFVGTRRHFLNDIRSPLYTIGGRRELIIKNTNAAQ